MTQTQTLYLVFVAVMFALGVDRDFHRGWLARVATLCLVTSTALSVSPAHAILGAWLCLLAMVAWVALATLCLVRSIREGTTYVRFSFGKRKRSPDLKGV